MSRKLAREDAFKMIFEMLITNVSPDNVMLYFNETITSDSELWAQKELKSSDKEYINNIIFGISKKKDEINIVIENKLKKWSLERISKVSLAVLQLAVYEIEYIEEIPFKVSVNEAVSLAKKYGGDEAGAFVNGVLGAVLNSKERNAAKGDA